MKNPFGDQKVPGDYRNLKERIHKRVSADVYDQILVLFTNSYEKALAEENVMLTRSERVRLLTQVVKEIMEDILKRFGGKSKTKKDD